MNELGKCLEEANTIINGERQDQYGNPGDSFKIIAGYWNVFLRAKLGFGHKDVLTPLDVVNMMVLFKQARKLGQAPKRDNYIDSAGYEAIGADRLLNACQEKTEKPWPQDIVQGGGEG